MAIYLRNDIWWFEYRTRSVRIQKSTGFKKADKKKAQAVFDAVRVSMQSHAPQKVAEGLIKAIYKVSDEKTKGLALAGLWTLYEDWMRGKHKVIEERTKGYRKNRVADFVTWAHAKKIEHIKEVDVPVALAYASHLAQKGIANKTVRNILQCLSSVWRATAQIIPDIHNPWEASVPDKDGKAERLLAFTPEEETRLLAACTKIGHDWHLASLISRYTALRYSDVATLTWDNIDLQHRTIDIIPKKTSRHGTRLFLPIADTLYAAFKQAQHHEGFVLPEHALKFGNNLKMRPPFSSILKACGLDPKRYSFHSWRHTCTSRLSAAGASTEVLRRFGGWTSDNMAHHYDHAKRLDEMASYLNRT